MKTTRDEVYAAIDGERDYQDQEWGNNNNRVGEELVLLATYVGEAMNNWRRLGDGQALRYIRKVAGIAVRCMENHGAPKR